MLSFAVFLRQAEADLKVLEAGVISLTVCVCVRACVRACVRTCVRARVHVCVACACFCFSCSSLCSAVPPLTPEVTLCDSTLKSSYVLTTTFDRDCKRQPLSDWTGQAVNCLLLQAACGVTSPPRRAGNGKRRCGIWPAGFRKLPHQRREP